MVIIIIYSVWKKVPAYENFVDGGKEGIKIAVSIIPFLVGMLVAITVFRTSGALDFFVQLIKPVLEWLGIPTEIVPLALIRPISGNAALGMMSDILKVHGPDTFIGKLASTIQGSTDTTLYVLTVYFGAVGIKKNGGCIESWLIGRFGWYRCSYHYYYMDVWIILQHPCFFVGSFIKFYS